MIIAIHSSSACEFWMNARCQSHFSDISLRSRTLTGLPRDFNIDISHKLAEYIGRFLQLTQPYDIFVPCAEKRSRLAEFHCAVRPARMPLYGFIELKSPYSSQDNRILIASPELCFLQMAQKLGFEDLIYLGYELCSSYMYDDSAEYKLAYRQPVTNVHSIMSFLDSANGCAGIKPAAKAVRHILDMSASPMETKLMMIATLPFSRGGFAIAHPHLNREIQLSSQGTSVLRQDKLYADALWEKEKVILEYDSNMTHLTKKQHDRDKNRIAALTYSGYKVIPMTSDDTKYFSTIEKNFRALRHALGLRKEGAQLDKYEERRRNLVYYLKTQLR